MVRYELRYFHILKSELEEKYKDRYPGSSMKITKWRQQEIIRFQKLMQEIVKDRISEKWFYTHIKPEKNTKMPRIDTLNLLTEFLGYTNWEDFKSKKGQINNGIQESLKLSFLKRHKISIIIITIIMAASGITYSTGIFNKAEPYEFCFVDADTKDPILTNAVEIVILHENQSPEMINCDTNACFVTEITDDKITFIVKANYYRPDTISRNLNRKNRKEIVQLKQDDYSVMIHLFSTSKIEDWEKRRKKLNRMIAEDAEIFQIDNKERDVELYNKEEFIDKMTMPVRSVKNIEIIEVTYQNSKIFILRFIQKSN